MIGLLYVIILLVLQLYTFFSYSIPNGTSFFDVLKYVFLTLLLINYIIDYFKEKTFFPKRIIITLLICFIVLATREFLDFNYEALIGFIIILPFIVIIISKQLIKRI